MRMSRSTRLRPRQSRMIRVLVEEGRGGEALEGEAWACWAEQGGRPRSAWFRDIPLPTLGGQGRGNPA